MAGEVLSKCVAPGSKVDIREVKYKKFSENEILEVKDYKSQVYEVISEKQIEIAMPMEKLQMVLLPVGEEYDLFFYSPGNVYYCKAKLLARGKKENIFTLVMQLTTDLSKSQRREYYRISCHLNMESRALTDEEIIKLERGAQKEELIIPDLPTTKGMIVDISGGGFRFVSDSAYEVGAIILCKYQLVTKRGSRIHEILCNVLAVKMSENRTDLYEHRVTYFKISRSEREEIIQYIFTEDRKRLIP